MNLTKLICIIVIGLLYACNTDSALIKAIKNKESDQIATNLEKSDTIAINTVGECHTALMAAVKNKDAKLVETLLEKGADPNLRSRECEYILDIGNGYKIRVPEGHDSALTLNKDLEIAKLLLVKGANINAVNMSGDSALDKAVSSGNLELVNFLLSKGASTKHYNRCGVNSLIQSAGLIKEASVKSKITSALKSKGASNFNFTKKAIEQTEDNRFSTYKHIESGSLTSMNPQISIMLFTKPEKMTQYTYSAAHEKYIHMSDFEWVDNNQNLWEWYILRIAYLDSKKDTGARTCKK